jgi:hypothetical protein
MQYVKPILMTLFTFLTPIKGLLSILFLFIFLDTITAIYVSVKTKGWRSFKSIILRKGIGAKLLFYLGSAVLAFMIDSYIVGYNAFGIHYLLAKTVASLWIYVEIKSLDETSMKLGNRSVWVIFREMIRRVSNIKKELKDTE